MMKIDITTLNGVLVAVAFAFALVGCIVTWLMISIKTERSRKVSVSRHNANYSGLGFFESKRAPFGTQSMVVTQYFSGQNYPSLTNRAFSFNTWLAVKHVFLFAKHIFNSDWIQRNQAGRLWKITGNMDSVVASLKSRESLGKSMENEKVTVIVWDRGRGTKVTNKLPFALQLENPEKNLTDLEKEQFEVLSKLCQGLQSSDEKVARNCRIELAGYLLNLSYANKHNLK